MRYLFVLLLVACSAQAGDGVEVIAAFDEAAVLCNAPGGTTEATDVLVYSSGIITFEYAGQSQVSTGDCMVIADGVE